MAAVTGGLVEAQASKVEEDEGVLVGGTSPVSEGAALAGLGEASLEGLGNLVNDYRALNRSHYSLTRTVWVRRALEMFGANVRFALVQDGIMKLRITQSPFKDKAGRPIMPGDVVPWSRTSPFHQVALWGAENSKMNCPVFDLPAGGLSIGGSCPGATLGQSVTNPTGRGNVTTPDGQTRPVELNKAICQSCYATSGNFQYANIQFTEVLRYWWCRNMLQAGRMDEMVDALVHSITLLRFEKTPFDILPIRLHGSGDFFSPDYAEAWCRVADKLHAMGGNAAKVRMWAPTRTWVGDNFKRFWAERLPRLASVRAGGPPNLIVRPSAYHFDDPAPGPLSPSNAQGSTSLLKRNDPGAASERAGDARAFFAQGEAREKYDWRCPTYSVAEGSKSCSNATNPQGGTHCRACWVRPELRINYLAH